MSQTAASPSLQALVLDKGLVTEIPPQDVATYAGGGFVWLHVDEAGQAERGDLPAYVPPLAANALLASETRPRWPRHRRGPTRARRPPPRSRRSFRRASAPRPRTAYLPSGSTR